MKTRFRRTPLVAGAALFALVLSGTTPAFAASDADPDAVAEAVTAAAPTALDALAVEQAGDQLRTSFTEGGQAEFNVDPVDGLSFTTDTGEAGASLSLPGAADLGSAVVSDDGSVTYAGDAQVPSVNILAADDAVRVSTVIAAATQTESFAYDFGAGATVEIQEDGSALVLTDGESTGGEDVEVILARVDVPWATDAAGKTVETHYVADGSVLTQVVKHQSEGTAYPVVADPSFDQPNIFQYRVRFNRAETATIAQYGLASLGGAVCGPVMALACILAAGAVAWNAGVAQNSNPKRCVQITATNTYSAANIIWWVDTYAGGPCK
ncbi:hypothetical protein [Microbacterium sp. TPD7012]|uniref:hypothetical protein n=1 Tax=Microbacterium sp. TPD7012 TaxID=2171975 RepID=UPI000D5190C5|nr:hypothetical protein [Microbacterium sp. TPD7012]PVE94122.1 hypothetical protein DC434_15305 [Microbacterium sp. TPD7012]